MNWKIIFVNNFIKWFRKIGFCGWIRFKITRIGYKLLWKNSPRNGEWDFVLQWLGVLEKNHNAKVLDVGSTDSLFIYALQHRGYEVQGIDQRPYQEPNEHTFIVDVLKPIPKYFGLYDYIVAISSLEHVGLGAYGDNKDNNGDKIALENLHKILKDNGYFIITLPNKHFLTKEGRSYSYFDFKKLIDGLFEIIHFEERNNQVCAVLVKKV